MTARLTTLLTCPLLWLVFLSSVCQGSVYSDSVIFDTGPVLYWNLDETGGLNADDLVDDPPAGSNDGIRTFQAAWGADGPRPPAFPSMGAGNAALSLDGQNDTVVYTALTTTAGITTGAYSAQTWFNSSAPFTNKVLGYVVGRGDFTGGNPYSPVNRDAVGVMGNWSSRPPGSENKLFVIDGSGAVIAVGNRVLQPDTWYHTLLVRDGNTMNAYLNGRLEISATTTWQGGTGDLLTVGGRADYVITGHLTLNGRVDEAAVWDRALTAGEAWGLFTAALDGPYYARTVMDDMPEAYWRLNETTGNNTAADFSGQGHEFAYHATPTRTGTAPDVGPRPAAFGGFEPGNNAPTLVGGPESPRPGGLTDGYVGIPTGVLPGENDYSAEMWFRRGAVGSIGAYLMHRNDLDAATNTGDLLGLWPGDQPGEINLFLYNGGWPEEPAGPGLLFPGERDVLEDEWYHVGMVREGNEVLVYLNGELEIEATMPLLSGTKWTDGTWAFGGRTDAPQLDQKFTGNIDEIAIYAGALDPSVFAAHYYAARVPEPSTWMLLALGGLALAAWGARRRAS